MREEWRRSSLLANISKRLLKESCAAEDDATGAARERLRIACTVAIPRRVEVEWWRVEVPGGSQSQGRSKSASAAGQDGGGRKRGSQRNGGGSAQPLTDHEEIRQWAEERGGTPACVRGTGGQGDIGMLRLDFPGYSGEHSLEPIAWDDWFEKFDERGLASSSRTRLRAAKEQLQISSIATEAAGSGAVRRPKPPGERFWLILILGSGAICTGPSNGLNPFGRIPVQVAPILSRPRFFSP